MSGAQKMTFAHHLVARLEISLYALMEMQFSSTLQNHHPPLKGYALSE
jgi:hypothetical protein